MARLAFNCNQMMKLSSKLLILSRKIAATDSYNRRKRNTTSDAWAFWNSEDDRSSFTAKKRANHFPTADRTLRACKQHSLIRFISRNKTPHWTHTSRRRCDAKKTGTLHSLERMPADLATQTKVSIPNPHIVNFCPWLHTTTMQNAVIHLQQYAWRHSFTEILQM